MIQKIKQFLSNSKVQLVMYTVLVADVIGLIIGGQTIEGISSVIPLIGGITGAIALLVIGIKKLIGDNK